MQVHKISNFKNKVILAVKKVPYGKVASYGQIALMIGVPKASQAVGQVLNGLEEELFSSKHAVPWWRIVNNAGRISIKGTRYHNALMQKSLLEKEGLMISDDLTFDIEKYRYRPMPEELKDLELDERYIEMILAKYFY